MPNDVIATVKVMPSCNITSQHMQKLLEAYFKKNSQWLARKRIHYLYEVEIVKSVTWDHHLSLLGKPCDAKG